MPEDIESIGIAIRTFKTLLFIIQMEEDRKKQELRAKEMDVKEDEGIYTGIRNFVIQNAIKYFEL